MKIIFIDTEFTNLGNPSIMSLGMVADTGEELYVEVPYVHSECSTFVREVVMPQLGRSSDDYCTLADLRTRILRWLSVVRDTNKPVVIGFDHNIDWKLFTSALDNNVPAWCVGKDIVDKMNAWLIENHYSITGDTKHHALHDARANRYAYREQIGRKL